jgi:hypothetical protein
MPTEHELVKRWMVVRLRIERETWKHEKGVLRNRYWKKMIDAGQEEVWLHVKPSSPEMEQYKHDNACRNRGSSVDRLVVNAEQDQNGHAFQTSASISAGARDDWMTQEKLQHEFDGAMRFP